MSVTISDLPGGIRLATDSLPHVETVTFGIWVDVGSRDESAPLNGISHLVEHMVFKGTKKRSARQIAEEIESVGGQLNAHTTRDHTAFHARVLKEDVPLAVDLIADLLLNPACESTELAREQEVIVQEIGQAHDTPDDVVFDHIMAVAFPDQAIGRSIMGTPANLRAIGRDDVLHHLDQHYRGDRLIVAAAGAIDHATLEQLIRNAFPESERTLPHRPPAEFGGGARHDDRPLDQLVMTLGFPAIGFRDPGFYALQLLSTLLGGGMSSRLFQRIREEHGLAYSIFSFVAGHPDTGLFMIEAGTSAEAAPELLHLVAEEVARARDDLPPAELSRAKAQLKAGLLMALENTSARAERLATQLQVHGRVIDVAEIVDRIDAVTRDDLTGLLDGFANGPAPAFAAVGPTHNVPAYQTITELFRP